jgi:hypothetical protein
MYSANASCSEPIPANAEVPAVLIAVSKLTLAVILEGNGYPSPPTGEPIPEALAKKFKVTIL